MTDIKILKKIAGVTMTDASALETLAAGANRIAGDLVVTKQKVNVEDPTSRIKVPTTPKTILPL
jgi:hypothetical protein